MYDVRFMKILETLNDVRKLVCVNIKVVKIGTNASRGEPEVRQDTFAGR
jgi:hypothetical protein